MSENFSSEEIKKLWPKNAPPISNIQKYVEKYKEDTIVIKYGGNVLIDREVFNNFIFWFDRQNPPRINDCINLIFHE